MWDAENAANGVPHRLGSPSHGKHEAEARIGRNRFQTSLEASQIRTFRFAVEKPHAFVDEGDQIWEAIGNGRVGADALPVRQLPPQGFRGQRLGALHFFPRKLDKIAQYIEFHRIGRAPAKDHVCEFFKPQHPERQLDIRLIDGYCEVRKCARELVVWI